MRNGTRGTATKSSPRAEEGRPRGRLARAERAFYVSGRAKGVYHQGFRTLA